MAGYSGTPLAAKLGIREGMEVCTVNAPKDYAKLVAPLPSGASIKSGAAATSKLVHLFATKQADLAENLRGFRKVLGPDSAIWVSWPKKSAKTDTDITEDTIRAVALPLGFVDIKVCAVNELWSGLKLVVRKKLR
jgi:hypothetical protein